MQAPRSPLDLVTIRTPCTESWDRMQGDERKRFCGSCRLHVYDLSAMHRTEAEALISSRRDGERLCVRFARRPDGRVVTDDCGPVRRAVRRRARRAKAAAMALFAMFFPAWATACSRPADGPLGDVDGGAGGADGGGAGSVEPPRPMGEAIAPEEMMGRIVCPPTPPDPDGPERPKEMGDVVAPR